MRKIQEQLAHNKVFEKENINHKTIEFAIKTYNNTLVLYLLMKPPLTQVNLKILI